VADGKRRTAVATPPGMALVRAGTFAMGDNLDGESDAIPTRLTLPCVARRQLGRCRQLHAVRQSQKPLELRQLRLRVSLCEGALNFDLLCAHAQGGEFGFVAGNILPAGVDQLLNPCQKILRVEMPAILAGSLV